MQRVVVEEVLIISSLALFLCGRFPGDDVAGMAVQGLMATVAAHS